ncbi:MAG: hypothetical protein AB1405_04215 [Bdellovibrionota bacterium]
MDHPPDSKVVWKAAVNSFAGSRIRSRCDFFPSGLSGVAGLLVGEEDGVEVFLFTESSALQRMERMRWAHAFSLDQAERDILSPMRPYFSVFFPYFHGLKEKISAPKFISTPRASWVERQEAYAPSLSRLGPTLVGHGVFFS